MWRMTPRGKALLLFVVLASLVALEAWRLANPAPAPDDVSSEAFSATRAIAALKATSLDAPHPVGTPAHDQVRDRLATALRAMDYVVEIQHAFACNAWGWCAAIDNIIARRPDAPPGRKAIVVAAHYDSVAAGPGASDDGTGVATVLELARATRKATFANPPIFLLDDGEEIGLLGAEAFVADARAKDAAFFINLEARGTTGTPYLFETSREQRWLIPIVARALPHPVTTSLFATVYDLLPNDTDLTVYKRVQRAGINFAYLGGGTQYHTPLDDFAHIDAGSVQRRGDQALAMLHAFGQASFAQATGAEPAVWFDVFAAFVVWWPARVSFVLVAIAAIAVGRGIGAGRRRGAITGRGVGIGVASFVATLGLAIALGVALVEVLSLGDAGALFSPHPLPRIAAAWLAGLAAALAASALARRWTSVDSVLAGHAVGWNLLALATSLTLPGASYIFVVPAVFTSIAVVLRGAISDTVAGVIGLVAAAVVLLSFALVGYDALGELGVFVAALLVALLASTFAPVLDETAPRLALACGALAIVATIAALLSPDASPSHPRHLALAYVSDGTRARWQAEGATDALLGALPLAASESGPTAPAPLLALAPISAAVTTTPATSGTYVVAFDLASNRGAPLLSLAWRTDATLVSVRINDQTMPPPRARRRDMPRVVIQGAPARVELTLRGAATGEALITETSFGLPPIGAPLSAVRAAGGAVPVHGGDTTAVERRVRW